MKIYKVMLTDIIDNKNILANPINENISEWIDDIYKYAKDRYLNVEQIVYVPIGVSCNYLIIFSN